MKTTTAALLAFTLSMLALSSHADISNPKPNCPQGQIAVFENNDWDCKPLKITSNETPQGVGLLLPAVQAAHNSTSAQPGGPKPTCPAGQIAKLELGLWQCKQLDRTAAPTSTLAQPGSPKPTCPVGQIAKFELGLWQCKDMHIAAPHKPE